MLFIECFSQPPLPFLTRDSYQGEGILSLDMLSPLIKGLGLISPNF